VETLQQQPPSGPKHNNAPLRGLMLSSSEGRILTTGIAMALLYIIWLAFQLLTNPADFQTLLGMTVAEVICGRIVCISIGYSSQISYTRVILICMLVETILVLVFYPLFVFIWRQLLEIRWLKRFSDRTYKAALRHKDKVRRYGIIGLFIFVWLPFWMTGPVVGCMIGYLLGMRIRVNLATVLAGTYVAILGSAYLLHKLHQQTLSYSSWAIVIVAAVAAAAGLAWSLRRYLRNNSKGTSSLKED